MSLPLEECYPPQLLAQRLNNRAANCIESKDFETAISHLVKALRTLQKQSSDHSCANECCSLNSCLLYSQNYYQMREPQSESSATQDEEGSYLHIHPIRVPQTTLIENHHMGMTLPLIATFNLALANHLALLEASKNRLQPVVDRERLQNVLQLYELAYRWQMDDEINPQTDCVHFTIIIANNLAEIHRLARDEKKYRLCLQHLLSTIMFVVDCKDEDCGFILDGFFRNTSGLILHGGCAGAA